MAPSLVGNDAFEEWWGRFERYSSSPGNAVAYAKAHIEDDVRDLLSAVAVPTLVIQRADDTYRGAGQSRYIAEGIRDAQYIEIQGRDHLPYVGDQDAIIDEVQEFLTGVRSGPESNRVLATVLFTDIVDSTKRAAELGDSRWHELLELHNQTVMVQLTTHRGERVDTAGDGMLAMFDGPARAVRCALAVAEAVDALGVHIGARVAGLAQPDEVLVSSTVKDLVAGSGIEFLDRGLHELKGVPDKWHLFSVRT